MEQFPPPHRVLFEPMNDRQTLEVWNNYKIAHKNECDFEEVDAAIMNSMEDFAKWFAQWTNFGPSSSRIRVRLLIVWHAHFLSLACQQMLRRLLEQKSFRCRVWFHIEECVLQQAILSRCIVSVLPAYTHKSIRNGPALSTALWDDPRAFETNLKND